MSPFTKAGVIAFAGFATSAAMLTFAGDTAACSASQTEVHRSAKTVWCVENAIVSKYGAFPAEFYPYSDAVVDQLVAVFHVPAEGVYTFEASVANGSAHTGSECCGLGVTVTGDAFYNDSYGARGFWGYLLSLHEMINDFTGQVSGGWPTDFWADHISAFPNSMDWHIMETLGKKDNDANLAKASAAQKKRFYPGGDSVDPRVPMFDKIYDMPNYGYEGLSRVFGFVKSDKMSWDRIGVPNPDRKRTEFVFAYLSLGAGTPVTSIMKSGGVGNGAPSGAGDPGYVVDDAVIDSVANAHCTLAAATAQGKDVAASSTAFRAGNLAGVTVVGACGSGCPSECGCRSSTNRCVAKWLADPPATPPDSGAGSAGDGGAGTGSAGDGSTGSGGTTGAATGTAPPVGANSAPVEVANEDGGCNCRVAPGSRSSRMLSGLAVGLAACIGAVARSRTRSRARRR